MFCVTVTGALGGDAELMRQPAEPLVGILPRFPSRMGGSLTEHGDVALSWARNNRCFLIGAFASSRQALRQPGLIASSTWSGARSEFHHEC